MIRMLLAAAVAVALTPTAAQAASITRDAGGALNYSAAPGAKNQVGLQSNGGIVFYTSGDPITSYPAGCVEDSMYGADVVTCATATAVRVDMGDGDDYAYTTAELGIPTVLSGGPGADLLKGDVGPDTLDGGAGDDELTGSDGADVLVGGDGNDDIDGAGGADRIDAGAGDDLLHPDGYERPAADVVDGGPGRDTIDGDYSSRFSDVDPPVAFTLEGGADDGRPGEGDDVRSVERLEFNVSGRYVGTEGADEIKVRQVLDPIEMTGRGGDDRLVSADGPDRLDGGAGADYLDGGFGDDTITGGPGRDTIFGDIAGGDCGPMYCKLPYGNDTIDARDGEIDSVDCGAGTDAVTADTNDVVAPNCETVTRAGGGANGPGTTSGDGAGANKGSLRLGARVKLRKALASGFTVRVAGGANAKVNLIARRGKTIVARGSGKGTVRMRFTPAAKRKLKHVRSVKLTVTGGGLRTTVTLRR